MRRVRSRVLITMLAMTLAAPAAITAPARVPEQAESDVAAARRLFQANLDAIRHRDRDAYLACYLQSPTLARTGPTGFQLGYASMESTRGQSWPDHFEGLDLRLTPVQPGVVYGTYRYRVRYGAVEQAGLSERVFVATPGGWKIAVSTAFQNLPGVPAPPRAIVGATLIDGRGGPPVRDAVVVLRDGRIEAAGPRSRVPIPAGVDTLDARGLFVLPGLVDAHVHYAQTGWADGRPDALDFRAEYPYADVEQYLRSHPERYHRAYLASGVTAVFDVGGYAWSMRTRDDAETSTEAPHMCAAGPLLSTLDHWLNLPAERQFMVLTSDSAARAGVRYLEAIGSNAVKVWFINRPSMDFAANERYVTAAGDEARKLGLPLIVHATGLQEAKAALRAGAKLLVHSVDDRPVDADFLAMCRRNGTIYCPTLTVRDGYVRMYRSALDGRPPDVDDPNGAIDSVTLARVRSTPQTARRARASRPLPRAAALDSLHRQMADNLMRVMRAGIPIAMGTDAGNPLTLHGPAVYAEMEAMQKAGMSPMEVIVAATKNGARAMGRAKEFGTIEKGKAADLLLVAGDPARDVANLRHVRWVARAGVLRSIEEMRAAIHAADRRR